MSPPAIALCIPEGMASGGMLRADIGSPAAIVVPPGIASSSIIGIEGSMGAAGMVLVSRDGIGSPAVMVVPSDMVSPSIIAIAGSIDSAGIVRAGIGHPGDIVVPSDIVSAIIIGIEGSISDIIVGSVSIVAGMLAKWFGSAISDGSIDPLVSEEPAGQEAGIGVDVVSGEGVDVVSA